MRSRSIRSFLFALVILALPVASSAQIILSIGFAPPPLPVYEQPVCPDAGYIWTPGYWAYAQEGYFWVPGTWAMAPEPGLLWTPGYWGWGGSEFTFNEGYWGTEVGFYGGINYGFGYGGVGYQGGYWKSGAFFYNRSVNNVTNVTNIYTKNVTVNNVYVSYNGGSGGLSARPTAVEQKAGSERHTPPTSVQTQHVQSASSNHELYESVNHGKPAIAATAKPGEFSGAGVVAAKAAAPSYKPATARAETKEATARPATAAHASELKPAARPAPNTVHATAGQAKHQSGTPAQQKVEQKHQQQTQQVAQKHAAQDQKLEVKQKPAAPKPAAKPASKPAPKPVAEKKDRN